MCKAGAGDCREGDRTSPKWPSVLAYASRKVVLSNTCIRLAVADKGVGCSSEDLQEPRRTAFLISNKSDRHSDGFRNAMQNAGNVLTRRQ